jgi:hypothetical protein
MSPCSSRIGSHTAFRASYSLWPAKISGKDTDIAFERILMGKARLEQICDVLGYGPLDKSPINTFSAQFSRSVQGLVTDSAPSP